MRKVALFFMILIISFAVLVSCAPSFEDWDIFEFPYDSFPDEITFNIASLPRSSISIVGDLEVAEYPEHFFVTFSYEQMLVKQVGDEWKRVPFVSIIVPGIESSMHPGNIQQFMIYNGNLENMALEMSGVPQRWPPAHQTKERLSRGTYRMVLSDVILHNRERRDLWAPGERFVWRGSVWAEFEVR